MNFAETVKKNAEIFKAMKRAGLLTDREVELLELAGLDVDEKRENLKLRETLKPKKSVREPRKARKPRRSVIMLSKPVKTVQDRLKF